MVKVIFFDAVGTLFDVDRGVGFQYHRMALKYGVILPPELLKSRFHKAMQKSPPLAFPGISPLLLPQAEKEWWRRLVHDVFSGDDFTDFSSFFEELYAFFAGEDKENSPWIRFEEAMDVLTNLSRLGYPLGIISNFDSRIHSVLASLEIAHFFQTVIFSSQEGVAKPSAVIFNRALGKAGCTPHEAIHIGDDPESDGAGAIGAGLSFIQIHRGPHSDPAHPYKTIHNLREIYNYL